MATYFNEIDTFAAEWLGNLFPGEKIDTRSIKDVQPADVLGFDRVHLFAGIGGWELALNLAGWPRGLPAWTGSCPCQPFSAAGKRKGAADERHLWPEMFRLVRECRPAIVVGEQVASADGLAWLDGVFADLEGAGYSCGAGDLCAAGIGAPHIRQRLYWVAIAECGAAERRRLDVGGEAQRTQGEAWQRKRVRPDPGSGEPIGGVAIAGQPSSWHHDAGQGSSPRAGEAEQPERIASKSGRRGGGQRLGDSGGERLPQRGMQRGIPGGAGQPIAGQAADVAGGWSDYTVIPCRDGKARRISAQRGDEPLAHGIPATLGREQPRLRGVVRRAKRNRVGRLRGYGNAIVPELAAEFLRVVLEIVT